MRIARAALTALFVEAAALSAATFDVRAFGAKGDGKTLDSAAINKAVDAAAAAGGGTVEIGAGTYVTGSIRLRSNITLHLERGAVLQATAKRRRTTRPNSIHGTVIRISAIRTGATA